MTSFSPKNNNKTAQQWRLFHLQNTCQWNYSTYKTQSMASFRSTQRRSTQRRSMTSFHLKNTLMTSVRRSATSFTCTHTHAQRSSPHTKHRSMISFPPTQLGSMMFFPPKNQRSRTFLTPTKHRTMTFYPPAEHTSMTFFTLTKHSSMTFFRPTKHK